MRAVVLVVALLVILNSVVLAEETECMDVGWVPLTPEALEAMITEDQLNQCCCYSNHVFDENFSRLKMYEKTCCIPNVNENCNTYLYWWWYLIEPIVTEDMINERDEEGSLVYSEEVDYIEAMYCECIGQTAFECPDTQSSFGGNTYYVFSCIECEDPE